MIHTIISEYFSAPINLGTRQGTGHFSSEAMKKYQGSNDRVIESI